ncbi:AbiH family protein [Alistipes communis]|jgi:putative uncharacterized protein (fragment)
MNRIILIGNGFDLAHGLQTSYKDFIQGYHVYLKLKLLEDQNGQSDGLCSIALDNPDDRSRLEHFHWLLHDSTTRFQRGWVNEMRFDEFNRFYDTLSIKYENPFWSAINKCIESKNWVDIETEYYLWLKRIFKQDNCGYTCPSRLNEDMKLITSHLSGYLQVIQTNFVKSDLVKDCIRDTIYEPFSIRDISVGRQQDFRQFIQSRWKSVHTEDAASRQTFAANYGYSSEELEQQIRSYGFRKDMSMTELLQHIEARGPEIPDYYLLPDQVLLLNFNYTKMADLYLPEGSAFQVNHIHGELENENNPIIFGYGDELDEDYKTISNLNDNAYLTNIKSIRYLETDNYRRLLSFVDSAPYQIYIMGHSCGNSDRTLLNTLFEHRNCVSIKPYYHLKEDGTDNYIEIIQNISRNFNDMQLMRDRVVNKSYCRPLVPVGA